MGDRSHEATDLIVQDQSEAIAFLATPATYGAGIQAVERIDTHGAVVFLAGERAYKLKRAVRFPYMDFSTIERRRTACEAEIVLNRRTAPTLYLGTMAITRAPDGRLTLGGEGQPIDWVVAMARFDQDALFDKRAGRGQLDRAAMEHLAEAVAKLHADAERRFDFGGAAGMAAVIQGIGAGLLGAGPNFDPRRVAELDLRLRGALDSVGVLLDRRRDDGFVRRCHGDLHLRNICLLENRPVLFDAIEFNDSIACIDVFYDLAFLLMDLERRGLRRLANTAFNTYLDLTNDHRSLPALPLFLSCRAAIRAHTTAAAAATQPSPAEAERMLADAKAAFDLAFDFLSPPKPRLLAVGGLSGTGKSTLAVGLAPDIGPAPGAVVLRTDVLRKRLAGVDPTTRLPSSAYADERTGAVYRRLAENAAAVLASGHAAIADGVFARPDERATIAAVAHAAKVPFVGLWLEAADAVMEARIAARTNDASDATVAVLRRQRTYDVGRLDWHHIDATGDAASTLAASLALATAPDPGPLPRPGDRG